jgi:hypothetical protein
MTGSSLLAAGGVTVVADDSSDGTAEIGWRGFAVTHLSEELCFLATKFCQSSHETGDLCG